jgi:hypothetical protein
MAKKNRLPIQVLDRSRAYGDVYGETQHQVKYTQNAKRIEGWPYDVHENLVEEALNDKQRDALAAMRKAAGITEADIAEAKKAAEEPAEEPAAADADDENYVEPDAKTKDDDGINLTLWLQGEQRVKPTDIQKVLKTRFGVNKPGTQAQALYLVEEQKLLARDQVHPSILPKAAV